MPLWKDLQEAIAKGTLHLGIKGKISIYLYLLAYRKPVRTNKKLITDCFFTVNLLPLFSFIQIT